VIDALSNVPLQGAAIEKLDRLSQSQSKDGHPVAAFNPVTAQNIALFKALLSGEFAQNRGHKTGVRSCNVAIQPEQYPHQRQFSSMKER